MMEVEIHTIGGRGFKGMAFISISMCSTMATVGSLFLFRSQHDEENIPKTCSLRSCEVTVCTVGKMT